MKQLSATGQGRGLCAVVALLALCAACAAQTTGPRATATAPASRATTRPSGPRPYQPGVWIDWSTRQVLLAGQVVLRTGDLELFACAAGSKEHESILSLSARPLHVFEALGLLGFEPGHPPCYDTVRKKVIPAQGERLDILVRWNEDHQDRTVPIEHWMRDRNNAVPGPIDWVFAGSMRLEDGRLMADLEGTVLCVVDFDGPIIAVAASHSADNADLWLAANTDRIPPVGTPVTLIVQAARPRLVFQVDRFGRLRQAGQPSSLREWVQGARLAAATPPGAVACLQYDPALPDVQVRQLARVLLQAGLADVTLQTIDDNAPAATQPDGSADAGEGQAQAILQTLSDLGHQVPSIIDNVARSLLDKYTAFSQRATAAGHAAASAARALGNVQAASPREPAK
jgi:hypothetical protein